MNRSFVVSCEHGGNRLPTQYLPLFRAHRALLHDHHGYDKGALRLSRAMAAAIGGDHHYSVVSRLLVDLNRSLGNPEILSPIISSLDEQTQEEILARYYHPYRESVDRSVAAVVGKGEQVLHLSCHSFTEELDGHKRDAEIGLLFDPVRRAESLICEQWKPAIEARLPGLQVRFNYPYLGVSDAVVTALRGRYPDPLYAGIEIEVRRDVILQPEVRNGLVDALRESCFGG